MSNTDRAPLTRAALAATLVLVSIGHGLAADRAPAEIVRGSPSAEEILAGQRALHAWLESERPALPPAAPIRVELSAAERAELQERAPGAGGVPMKIGIVRTLSPGVALSGLERAHLSARGGSFAGGTLAAAADGGFVWTTSIAAEGAGGIRAHLTGVDLPPSAEVYFFGGDDEAYGPFGGRGPNDDGDFWTPSVRGDEAVLLVRHVGPATAGDRRHVAFVVADVGYLAAGNPTAVEEAGASFCGNPPCIVDASCQSDPAVTAAMSAVAQLEWVSGAFLYTCTGGLLADTDTATQIPYLLTANHCISRGRDAKNLEAFFFYRTTACGGSCPSNSAFPKTLGATIKATGSAGDFTLLQLNQTPPSGTAMLGWNKNPIAFSDGADLYRISHPNFGPQTFSHHRVDTSATTCTSWPRGQRIYSRDVVGATDGGSSGSPVVNAAGEVVGQLSGGCGYNVTDVCDAVSNATVDGALAYYFGSVAAYLDPTPCAPTPEVCTDGVDNDCDGAVDCADGDCSGDPACTSSCTPSGGTCTSNGQCCSANCKGKPGQKTCK
jgi:lysyl endopeptidase